MIVPRGFINVTLENGTTALIRMNSIALIERKDNYTKIKLGEDTIIFDEPYDYFVARLNKLLKLEN